MQRDREIYRQRDRGAYRWNRKTEIHGDLKRLERRKRREERERLGKK